MDQAHVLEDLTIAVLGLIHIYCIYQLFAVSNDWLSLIWLSIICLNNIIQ